MTNIVGDAVTYLLALAAGTLIGFAVYGSLFWLRRINSLCAWLSRFAAFFSASYAFGGVFIVLGRAQALSRTPGDPATWSDMPFIALFMALVWATVAPWVLRRVGAGRYLTTG